MRSLVLKIAKEDSSFRRSLILKLSAESKKPPGWEDFWNKVYDGGKKKVRNPNPKGSKEQVSASTAMKNDSFKKKVMQEFAKFQKENGRNKEKKVKRVDTGNDKADSIIEQLSDLQKEYDKHKHSGNNKKRDEVENQARTLKRKLNGLPHSVENRARDYIQQWGLRFD